MFRPECSSIRLSFSDAHQASSTLFDFHALLQNVLTFGGKSPANNEHTYIYIYTHMYVYIYIHICLLMIQEGQPGREAAVPGVRAPLQAGVLL